MELEKLINILESTGLPVAYLAFPEGEAPPLPFLCYLCTDDNPLFADGITYFTSTNVTVELYTQFKSPSVEQLVEAALQDYHWKKDETYIDSERCYMITYDIEV